jgi:hypothetical protein
MRPTLTFLLAALAVWLASPRPSYAQQEIETETARLLPHGVIEAGVAYELQRSSAGYEHALPLVFEVGLLDRFELLVEPVAITGIRPSAGNGPDATGLGDLETTLFGLVVHEREYTPAVSLATEVKFPTARNTQIGTGKTDVTFYAVASKRLGPFDVHANAGYTFVGQPAGVAANNIWSFALAGVLPVHDHAELFAEAYGNTAATDGEGGDGGDTGGGVLVPELSSGEIVGSAGAGWIINDNLSVSLGASYDTNQAFQLRAGITFRGRAFGAQAPPAPPRGSPVASVDSAAASATITR